MVSKTQRFISGCDLFMVFCFCAMIFFLPISSALVEITSACALIAFFVKRVGLIGQKIVIHKDDWRVSPLKEKVIEIFMGFKPRESVLNRPIFYFIIVSLISVITSQIPSMSWMGFLGKVLQATFIFFTFIECMTTRKRFKIFIVFLILSSTLIGINGIYQYVTGTGFIREHSMYDERISSSLRAHNDFGAYLAIVIPTLLGVLYAMIKKQKSSIRGENKNFDFFKNNFIKVIVSLSIVLSIVCLNLTVSRGAWLGLFCGLILFAIAFKRMRILKMIIVILMICAIIWTSFLKVTFGLQFSFLLAFLLFPKR